MQSLTCPAPQTVLTTSHRAYLMDSSDAGHLSVNLQVHLSSQASFIIKQRMLRLEVHKLETSLSCTSRPVSIKQTNRQTDKNATFLSLALTCYSALMELPKVANLISTLAIHSSVDVVLGGK